MHAVWKYFKLPINADIECGLFEENLCVVMLHIHNGENFILGEEVETRKKEHFWESNLFLETQHISP